MNLRRFDFELNSDLVWRLLLVMCAITVIVGASDIALAAPAADTNLFQDQFCKLLVIVKGPIARIGATAGVFAMGFGFFMGKVQWPTALAVVVGIVVVFSADKIVYLISGDDATDCENA